MKRLSVLSILVLVAAGWTAAATSEMKPFLGSWSIDLDRSVEAALAAGVVPESEAEQLPTLVRRMMETIQLRVTESELIYARGGKESVLPCAPRQSDGNAVTIDCQVGGQTMEATFTLLDKEHMSFKSSGSNDMDFIVWKRQP